MNANPQQEYWNGRYSAEGMIWGIDACLAAKRSAEVFKAHVLNDILVPGCGYGRNSLYLVSQGFKVTGFDVSDEAIELAREYAKERNLRVYYDHFDVLNFRCNKAFDGILSINMLHLFNKENRKKILKSYADLLNKNGILVLTSMSINDPDFGKGEKISNNTFESKKGRPIYYFDEPAMRELVSQYLNPLTVEEIKEHENHGGKEHYHMMIYLVAQK